MQMQSRENPVDLLIQNTYKDIENEKLPDFDKLRMVTKLCFNIYTIGSDDLDENGELKYVEPSNRQYVQFNLQSNQAGAFLYKVQHDQNCQVSVTDYFIYKYIIDKEHNTLMKENLGVFYQISKNENGRQMIVSNLYNKMVYIKYNKNDDKWFASINFNQYMFASKNGWMLIDYINVPLPEITVNELKKTIENPVVLKEDRQLHYQYRQLFDLFESQGEKGQSVANSYQFLIIGKTLELPEDIKPENIDYKKLYNHILDFIDEYNSLEVNFNNQINKMFFKKNVQNDSPVFKFLVDHVVRIQKYIKQQEVYIQPMYYQMFVLTKNQTEQNLINFEYAYNPIQQVVLTGNYKQDHVNYRPIDDSEGKEDQQKTLVFESQVPKPQQKPKVVKETKEDTKENKPKEKQVLNKNGKPLVVIKEKQNDNDVEIEIKHKKQSYHKRTYDNKDYSKKPYYKKSYYKKDRQDQKD